MTDDDTGKLLDELEAMERRDDVNASDRFLARWAIRRLKELMAEVERLRNQSGGDGFRRPQY